MRNASELAERMTEMAMRLHRRSRQDEEVHGLTRARLAALSRLVSERRLSLSRLAAAEGVTPATMARIIDWLEEGKLVVRHPSAADGRVVWIVPTVLGRSLARGAQRQRSSWLEPFLSDLSGDDRDTVAGAIEILARALESQS